MSTEAEIANNELQAGNCHGLGATTRSQEEAQKDSPLEPSEGAPSCQQLDLDFRPLKLRKYISVTVSHQFVVLSFSSPGK